MNQTAKTQIRLVVIRLIRRASLSHAELGDGGALAIRPTMVHEAIDFRWERRHNRSHACCVEKPWQERIEQEAVWAMRAPKKP